MIFHQLKLKPNKRSILCIMTFFTLALTSKIVNAEMYLDMETQLALITNPVMRAMATASNKAEKNRISQQLLEYGRIDENKPNWILAYKDHYVDKTVWIKEKKTPTIREAWHREDKTDGTRIDYLLQVDCNNLARLDTTGSVQIQYNGKEDSKPERIIKVPNDFKGRFMDGDKQKVMYVVNQKACSLKPLPAL